jgi:hypothetical protein
MRPGVGSATYERLLGFQEADEMFRIGNGLVSDLLDHGRNPHCLNLLQGSLEVPDVLNVHLSQGSVSLVHVIVTNLG